MILFIIGVCGAMAIGVTVFAVIVMVYCIFEISKGW